MSTSILREPVTIGFRGHERALPLAALALSFRRDPEHTATALEFLIQGPPERCPTTPSEDFTPAREDRGEGEGGGVRSERSETLGPGTLEQKFDQRSDPKRSERERRARDMRGDTEVARQLAVDLGDEVNVAAIRKLVAAHPRPLLDDALHRTLGVPADRIRSSRGAIFTGIVRKLARADFDRTYS